MNHLLDRPDTLATGDHVQLHDELTAFNRFGRATVCDTQAGEGHTSTFRVPIYLNEFWTAKQRAANRLHEISYRACFKPQLPRFFIERLTKPGEIVFDPFMGRGTTLLEAALLGRIPYGCDANPLCTRLIRPRLNPPSLREIQDRLGHIDFAAKAPLREDLLAFYHPHTLQQLCALRSYLIAQESKGAFDGVDAWIQMVALNRLTGHSRGFFSVYTLPPNQAVTVESQLRINERLNQCPEFRPIPDLILAKTKSLLRDLTEEARDTLPALAKQARLFANSCEAVPALADGCVDLIITSPPFLNVVDYASDNWLRNWFAGLDLQTAQLSIHRKLPDWEATMSRALTEMHRVLRPGGHLAFEVGEIQRGRIRLEESAMSLGARVGFEPVLVLINSQKFTKTANCWGVRNNDLGTNTNRVVLFRKADH